MTRIILTRCSADNEALVKCVLNQCEKTRTPSDFSRLDFCLPSKIIEMPLLTPQKVVYDKAAARESMGRADGVIVSSRNAIYALSEVCPRQKPVYAVGEATSAQLREAGFENISYTAKDMDDLLAWLGAHLRPEAGLCYVRGVHVSRDVAGWCAARSFPCAEIIVYDSVAATIFPPPMLEFLATEEDGVVVFFSRRAAESFINIAVTCGFKRRISRIKALCISSSVLESVEGFFGNCAYAASSPDLRGMSALISAHIEMK